MAKSKKQLVETPKKEVSQKEQSVLVMISNPNQGRFQVVDNQALVNLNELRANEKFVIKNGKNYIEVVEPTNTYLL